MKYTPEQVRAARDAIAYDLGQNDEDRHLRLSLDVRMYRGLIEALLSGDLEAVKAVLGDGYVICSRGVSIPEPNCLRYYLDETTLKAAQHNSGGK